MNKTVKILLEIVLLLAICGLVFALVSSIMKPVNFNKQRAHRETVAIQRLKDIRTLQVAYKSANGRFVSTIDSLKAFYENGKMSIIMQIGSADDSIAWEHTEKVKKANRKITPQQLLEMYEAGDKNLVFSVETKIPVKDTLFLRRTDFCIDSLGTIPFSGGAPVEMEAETRMVSGVLVPLFEARMPYRQLLKGMDNQLRINLDAERKDQNKYEGLQVGSVTAPNNNAGNWE
ncbi:MAG: type II secretion system protein [Bacteroidales bacterium]|nr:type II secretion system protein [Bacteroidales bacterium]